VSYDVSPSIPKIGHGYTKEKERHAKEHDSKIEKVSHIKK
jgi:hypothetical protein